MNPLIMREAGVLTTDVLACIASVIREFIRYPFGYLSALVFCRSIRRWDISSVLGLVQPLKLPKQPPNISGAALRLIGYVGPHFVLHSLHYFGKFVMFVHPLGEAAVVAMFN